MLLLFLNKFNKFNNTGAQKLYSIHDLSNNTKMTEILLFYMKTSKVCQIYRTIL